VILSCSQDVRTNDGNYTVFPWNLNESELIRDIIDSIVFTPLEAHPEGLFKKADKMIIHDGKVFIFDMLGQNQVMVFDNAGNFIYKVGKKGQGPGEYIGIRTFTIDENFIYVVDNYRSKMLKYSISDGTYLEIRDLPLIVHDMIIAENGDFVLTQQRIEGEHIPEKYAYHIIITDADFNVKYSLFPMRDSDCGTWSKPYYFRFSDKHIVFHTMVGDSLVLLNRHIPSDSSYFVYKMDFGSKEVPYKKEIQNDMELLTNYRFLYNTPEITSKYIVGQYWHDDNSGNEGYIYDMEKQKIYLNDYDLKHIDKFFFHPLFHVGDTVFAVYDKNYYGLWQKEDGLTDVLPAHIKNHLDEGDDVLIKYILK
jgi:hypothetical protein